MSEPLSKKLGISPIEEGTIVSGLMNGRECDAYIEGHNRAVRKLDQRSPEVEKLARIIYEQQYNRNININSSCPDWKKESPYVKERFFLLAQEIINKMNLWIVKKGNTNELEHRV